MKVEILKSIAKIASKSLFLKRIGNKLAVHMLPEEVELIIGSARFRFRPKTDGLWYFNYSYAEPGVEKVFYKNLSRGAS